MASHRIASHCIALHCIALHSIALHCFASHCIASHRFASHCITLHRIASHCIAKLLGIVALGSRLKAESFSGLLVLPRQVIPISNSYSNLELEKFEYIGDKVDEVYHVDPVSANDIHELIKDYFSGVEDYVGGNIVSVHEIMSWNFLAFQSRKQLYSEAIKLPCFVVTGKFLL